MTSGLSDHVRRTFAASAALLLVLASASCNLSAPETSKETRTPEPKSTTTEGRMSPWLKNLGDFERPVTTSSPEAQHFFNQGLTLYYGFNHMEAARSFQEAQRLDPKCAMAYWGQAISLGPNINDLWPDPDREKNAYAAIQKALELKPGSDPKEQALIEALAPRYTGKKEVDRKRLNAVYAQAMTKVYRQYADDPDIATLYAEAVMDTMPWDYWTKDGKPRPGMEKAIAALESVMKRYPEHPGANHFYIHAVEASTNPGRAVPSADRLGTLVPGAGHLVHMPSHIYIRVGRYDDAVEANRRAILADEDYITQCRAQGIYPAAYYPHNIHFLWTALIMEGRSRESFEAARKVASQIDEHALGMEGFAFGHLLRAIPTFGLTRFGKWDEILRMPEPGDDSEFGKGIWHYARGLAFNSKGEPDQAATELAKLRAIAADPELAKMKIFDLNSLADLLNIASEILDGELAAKRGEYDSAVAHLKKGVQLEDSLLYSEPPDWYLPVRQVLGAVLLEASRPVEAEQVYRQDLTRHPDNGWSLYGLTKSLEAQGKIVDAKNVRDRFARAWSRADVKLTASRL